MKLTEKDIELGFWYFKTRSPVYLNFDDQRLESEKSLGLGFYDEHNKSGEIKKWNKIIVSLEHVEYLWLFHTLNQETFDLITKMKNLKGLYMKWSSIKSLRLIENMTSLENFNLGFSTNITDIGPVTSLTNLATLESENLKNVKDWSRLSALVNLKGLGISGGMSESLELGSIDFLSELKNLEELFLINTSIKSNSLSPIQKLERLKCLRLSNMWTDEQFEELRK